MSAFNKPGFHDEIGHDEASLADSDDDCLWEAESGETERSSGEERDEKQEVYKMSAKDTLRVRLWRIAVTMVLLLTACAVTLTTYKFLKREELANFETAFARFSRTLADAALEEQKNIRDTMRTLASTIAGQAQKGNLTWPLVDIDLFEVFGGNARAQAKVEYISFIPRVQNHQVEDYLNFMGANYQRLTQAGQKIKWGDLSHLQNDTEAYTPYITVVGRGGFSPDDETRDEYWPSQQYSPPLSSYRIINHNVGTLVNVNRAIQAMKALQYETVFTKSNGGDRTPDFILGPEVHASYHSQFKDSELSNPHTYAVHPVHRDPTDPMRSEIVALITNGMAFDASLLNLLPRGVEGIICVVSNTENQTFTYEVVGPDAYFMGEEDHHDPKYDQYAVEVDLAMHTHPNYRDTPGHSQYTLHIYPSDRFRSSYDSNTPEIFAVAVAITFVLVALVFFVYDLFVFKRNENLVSKAAQSNAIVAGLFPEHMRDALMKEKEEDQLAKGKRRSLGMSLKDGSYNQEVQISLQKPLADLYLNTTVLFADISGFTAWSSVREPTQVFTLLETIFRSFDTTAKRRKVFKVETVGDCYVAVAGLPDPRDDHAVLICRFARDILAKFRGLTKRLEVSLGPDTADLALRVGIHSGQVTAGVLRGDRARFQLFGDTMNVCQRVEATGKDGRIHASRETADILRKMGKESWLEQRSESVSAKGVGLMETYWINPGAGDRAGSVTSLGDNSGADLFGSLRKSVRTNSMNTMEEMDKRVNRLINWNCEMLLDLMQQMAARRSARTRRVSLQKQSKRCYLEPSGNPLDEVKEIIALPAFDAAAAARQQDPSTVEIPEEVVEQLHSLVTEISRLYNNNPFHNFDHASHVVMSVTKLMSRIVAPSHLANSACQDLHDHTYGITSDPLTQFACAFSALIHDADHVGVSNAQLVKEGLDVASKYEGRSVAEQNSLDLSWSLLMESRFEAFRSFLFPTSAELQRFRQLVVNSVMSTDIVDKDLKALRNGRWEKAFQKGETSNTPKQDSASLSDEDNVNRKATIVIEHIIQASDISHTMQHWHVYRKWNQKLFEELYVAHLNGRLEKHPVDFWYKGEFGFFDFYIIPLTRKLKECGVFGVSSDEFLNYATKNREMWELHGEEAVAEMMEEAKRKYGVKKEEPLQEQALPRPGEMDV